MRIKKVIASSFGCLSGSYSFFDDRANVVVEENERGKSTLVAAILAGLYGLSPSRPRDRLTEKETYQPWKGGPYRVELEIEDDRGRSLRIERDFGEGKIRPLRVTDLSANKDVTEEFRIGKSEFAVGEHLLGSRHDPMSREVFLKTCLVKQLETEEVGKDPKDRRGLLDKVQQIFDASGGKATAAKAISVLGEATQKYPTKVWATPTVTIGKEIEKLSAEIEKRKDRIEFLDRERKGAAPSMAKLASLRSDVEGLEARRQQVEYLTRRAEFKETEAALKDDAENRQRLDKLVQRKESLKPYSDFPKEKAAEFDRLTGRLEELRKHRRRLTESLGKLNADLEAKNSALKQFEGFEAADQDFKTRLHDLSTELARLAREVEARSRRLLDAEESVRKDGFDLSEAEELSRRFSSLDFRDKDLLRKSESRIPEIEAKLVKLETRQKELCRLWKWGRLVVPIGLLIILGLLASGRLGLAAEAVVVLILGLAVCMAVAVYVESRAFQRLGVRNLSEARRRAQEAQQEVRALVEEREGLTARLEEMARTVGFGTTGHLSEAFIRWGPLEDRAKGLESMRRDVEEAQKQVASAKERASVELRKIRVDATPEQIDVTLLEEGEKQMGEYLDTVSSVKKLEEQTKKNHEEIAEIDREGKALRESIRGILAQAKLPPELAPEEAQPKVEEARQKSEEFHRLTARDIPELERRILPSEEGGEMNRRLESLRLETERRAAERPNLSKLEVTRKRSEYQEEVRKTGEEIDRKKDEKRQLFHHLEKVEDTYHEEYPRLTDQVAKLNEDLDRAERFVQSISIATKTLEEISVRSHARWAGTLNERTNEILKHINPRCKELKFDEDLSFTVVPGDGEEPKDQRHIDAQESVGARHQIYLAVRLALADYLSSTDTRLPVILDDPFATSDDERFLSGMRFLCGEFRKNHQVTVLTCHRQRHSELIREKAPDLLEEMRILAITPTT